MHRLALCLQRTDGKDERTTKVQSRQLKETLIARPVYTDAFVSFKLLNGYENMIEIVHVVHDAQQDALDLALRAES